MKNLMTSFVVLCLLVIGSVSWAGKASTVTQKQRAVAKFDQPVVLQGLVLEGQYLFVHDDAAMKRGEACTYVYKGNAEIAGNLVVSFHCTPVERAKATHFTFRTAKTSQGTFELREFQFEGDTEAHGVPPSVDHATINLVN